MYLKYIYYTKLTISNNNISNELKKNIELANKYKNQRCFIVGNGPSLKEQDLSLLSNEYVFTVNQIVRSKEYCKLKSNFHLLLDPGYFNLDAKKAEDLEVIEYLKKINTDDNKPICIFPYDGKEAIEKLGLNQYLNINYIMPKLRFHEEYNSSIDMSSFMPDAPTVVQVAIFCAIYMGFKKIYLLGCDMTGYESIKERMSNYNYSTETHIYQLTENEKLRLIKERNERSNEKIFYGYARMFTYYRRLRHYCNGRKIELYNTTKGGVLDNLPRLTYEEVIKDDTDKASCS